MTPLVAAAAEIHGRFDRKSQNVGCPTCIQRVIPSEFRKEATMRWKKYVNMLSHFDAIGHTWTWQTDRRTELLYQCRVSALLCHRDCQWSMNRHEEQFGAERAIERRASRRLSPSAQLFPWKTNECKIVEFNTKPRLWFFLQFGWNDWRNEQGRRHGFESGWTVSPHFLASGGDKILLR